MIVLKDVKSILLFNPGVVIEAIEIAYPLKYQISPMPIIPIEA